ncbi:MAG: hypothetical protein HY670_01685 [Chloroflexi bacterium]|nr:hypothetical protein [Chloroflexota bacterium]
MSKPANLVLVYIYLAIGCAAVGVAITFVVLFVCQYLGIDITKHLWVLAIPAVLAVSLNVISIELYLRHRRK